jgi:hypothetical protein
MTVLMGNVNLYARAETPQPECFESTEGAEGVKHSRAIDSPSLSQAAPATRRDGAAARQRLTITECRAEAPDLMADTHLRIRFVGTVQPMQEARSRTRAALRLRCGKTSGSLAPYQNDVHTNLIPLAVLRIGNFLGTVKAHRSSFEHFGRCNDGSPNFACRCPEFKSEVRRRISIPIHVVSPPPLLPWPMPRSFDGNVDREGPARHILWHDTNGAGPRWSLT